MFFIEPCFKSVGLLQSYQPYYKAWRAFRFNRNRQQGFAEIQSASTVGPDERKLKLLEPLSLGDLKLANRIFMARLRGVAPVRARAPMP